MIRAALAGVEPSRLVARAVEDDDVRVAIAGAAHVDVIAAGKAAGPMLAGLGECLDKPWRSALAISTESSQPVRYAAEWRVAAHPIPDERSERAGREALRRARATAPDDLLLVLLSGGASSLMAVPAETLTLADKRAAQAMLLRAGADIVALNTVRKHVSAIKGGRLAAAAAATVLTLIVSDVIGDDVTTIGSGPTVADATTFADALAVLNAHGGAASFPRAIVRYLEEGAGGTHAETVKTLDSRRAHAQVIGSIRDAIEAAAATAAALGYHVHRVDEPTRGEARAAGARLLREAVRAAGHRLPLCLLAGGETTVKVVGDGRGGRNQELVLSIVGQLADLPSVAAASIGTDGVDGPTDAAGAVADSATSGRAGENGLDASAHLDRNNSYEFFAALGDLVKTGPTGTNVGDIQIVMINSQVSAR